MHWSKRSNLKSNFRFNYFSLINLKFLSQPGQVLHVSDCKTCQCLNNEYICANVPCARQASTLPPLVVSSSVKTIQSEYVSQELPYYIRICDPSVPHVEHPNSCYKFLHCQPALNGSFIYAVKTCYPDMMFNPQAMVCDWPANVKAIKPKCGVNPGETEIWEVEETFIRIKSTTQRTVFKSSTSGLGVAYEEISFISQICDPSVPLIEHPETCTKYLQCQQLANGSFATIEKECGAEMMFNPNAMVCDWPSSVKALKPICGLTPQVLEIFDLKALQSQPATQIPMKIVSSTNESIVSQEFIELPYYITICDPSVPHIEHPKSCYKFLHCMPSPNGSYIYAVKTCYPDMMFNPSSMVCDWPASVKAIKPACGVNPGETEIWEIEETIIKRKSSRIPVTTQRTVFKSSTEQIGYGGIAAPQYIRVCNPNIPFAEHPESCYKYLECEKLPNGSFAYTEKTCGPDMMFNINIKDCGWPDDVIAFKPNCEEKIAQPVTITQPRQFTTARPETTRKSFVPTDAPIIVPSTLTPPMICDQGELVPLLNLLPDSALSASSILGNPFKPENARLESKPSEKGSGSWAPKTNDLNQFFQVTFPKPVPIHGIIIRGNPMFDQYVTSFKILHSYDGNTYHVYENSQNQPKIFSGSVDSKTPVKSILEQPIEAKIVRIYPISWHSAIALRVELLGCQKTSQPLILMTNPSTTQRPVVKETPSPVVVLPVVFAKPETTQSPMFTEAPIEPLCDDPLGVENSKISPSQIKFSSIKDAGSVKTKVRKNPLEIIKLSSARGWMPLADSTSEFVMVNIELDFIDFFDHR